MEFGVLGQHGVPVQLLVAVRPTPGLGHVTVLLHSMVA